MNMLEHPEITRTMRTGYPNMIAQPEHAGIDYFGTEIFPGDDVVEIDGELVLQDNLQKYLVEFYGAKFYTA